MEADKFHFRAWVPAGHNMNDEGEDYMCSEYHNDILMESCGLDPEGGMVVMQSTGIEDIKGQEIFEGDVVRCTFPFDRGTLPHMGAVEYDADLCGFVTKNEAGRTPMMKHCINTREVIGNIYENPELMRLTND